MDRTDYIAMFGVILKDQNKLRHLGPADHYDKTTLVERKLKDKEEFEKQVTAELSPQGLLDRACMIYRKPTRRTILSDPS